MTVRYSPRNAACARSRQTRAGVSSWSDGHRIAFREAEHAGPCRLVERAQHVGEVRERQALGPTLGQRAMRIAGKAQDRDVTLGDDYLAKVVVAVQARFFQALAAKAGWPRASLPLAVPMPTRLRGRRSRPRRYRQLPLDGCETGGDVGACCRPATLPDRPRLPARARRRRPRCRSPAHGAAPRCDGRAAGPRSGRNRAVSPAGGRLASGVCRTSSSTRSR